MVGFIDWISIQTGLGSYWVAHYAFLLLFGIVAVGLYLKFRKSLPPWIRRFLLVLAFILCVRFVLFGNPLAWEAYQYLLTPVDVGFRQMDAIHREYGKFRWKLDPGKLPFLAVGSSQIRRAFIHVESQTRGIGVFYLGGLDPVDFLMYKEYILHFNPAFVILYLSEYDLAKFEWYKYQYAPSQGLYLFHLYDLMRSHAPPQSYQDSFRKIFVGELFPEFKYAFIYKGLFHKAVQPPIPMMTDSILIGERRTIEKLDERALELMTAALEEFIGFCRDNGIGVIILEGQYNPSAATPESRRLSRVVSQKLQSLANEHEKVYFLPKSELYTFERGDYLDYFHVTEEAALKFRRALFPRLENIWEGPLSSGRTPFP